MKSNHFLKFFVASALAVSITLPAISHAQNIGGLLRGVLEAKTTANDWLSTIKSITDISFGQIAPGAGPQDADGKVILYSTSYCGYCKKATAFMQQNNIPFSERSIESNLTYQAEYKKLGGKGVPYMLFGTKTVAGYSEEGIRTNYANMQASKAAPPAAVGTAPAAPAPMATNTANTGTIQALQAGDSLIGKLPGITIFAQANKSGASLTKLNKTDEVVIYMGEERDGLYRVTTSVGEGWVDKLLVAKKL